MRSKRRLCAALLALCLALPGCAAGKPSWSFTVETRRDADDYTARDGTLLAWYSYELPRLALEGDDPSAEAAVARDTFNEEIERLRAQMLEEYEQMRQLALGDYAERTPEAREGFRALGNELRVTETYQTQRLLSVRADGEADWGGAHPAGFLRVWNYDLSDGRFVTWRDLTDDPDALRAALADEVLLQMTQRDTDWFDGAADAVERMEGCSVLLGQDALTLIFDEQLLAPRAAGHPEFTVEYAKLTRYFNSFGRRLTRE